MYSLEPEVSSRREYRNLLEIMPLRALRDVILEKLAEGARKLVPDDSGTVLVRDLSNNCLAREPGRKEKKKRSRKDLPDALRILYQRPDEI